MILSRAKFAEWLRAPQRGAGKWPHLYSGENYHMVKQDTREELVKPCEDAPSSLHHLMDGRTRWLHSSERVCMTASSDTFSRTI